MPEFRERAGFSPSWAAVLVQIEHCALTAVTVAAESIIKSSNILLHFSIKTDFNNKVRCKSFSEKVIVWRTERCCIRILKIYDDIYLNLINLNIIKIAVLSTALQVS